MIVIVYSERSGYLSYITSYMLYTQGIEVPIPQWDVVTLDR